LRIGRVTGFLLLVTALASAQAPPAPTSTDRLDGRIRALQEEAGRLAGDARTLVTDLRRLEVERNLRRAEALQSEAAVSEATEAHRRTTARLEELEQQRLQQLPALKSQLVDLYKRGSLGYGRLVFRANSLREFGRASRMVIAMAEMSRRRIETHRRTIEAVRAERGSIEERARALRAAEADAQQARSTAERAVTTHAARLAEIDSRRDLAAQYVGELQVARENLARQLESRADRTPAGAVPLGPFRGALEWPVDGRLTGRFGDTANRLGGSAVRNGIEIAAPDGAPVRAVHGGTVVHADTFAGLGLLVILDHGSDDYSLYGYLGGKSVDVGQVVTSGAELGHVGPAPAGPTALYFEMRIDGRSVDPVHWLQSR
jgi:septal ring factor EnvC (AmiA/AmiB activator)